MKIKHERIREALNAWALYPGGRKTPVAAIVDADLLIILSDVDGVYTANPQQDPTARLIPEIPEVTPEIEAICGGAGTMRGTGGMLTKMAAARMAMNSGIVMVIASGAKDGVVQAVLQLRQRVVQLGRRKRDPLAQGQRSGGVI